MLGQARVYVKTIESLQGRPQMAWRDIERVPYAPNRACLMRLRTTRLSEKGVGRRIERVN